MATGRGASWRGLLGKMVGHQTMSSSRSAEAPTDFSFSGEDAVDRHVKGAARSRSEELPAGEAGEEEDAMEKGSTSVQLIGPPPPFEAFLLPGTRVPLLQFGWGTKVPYKRDNKVDEETYSKLFDKNGYYKLIGKRVESNNNEKSAASCIRSTVDLKAFGQLFEVHDTTLLHSSESETGEEEGSEKLDDSGDSDDQTSDHYVSDGCETSEDDETEQIVEDADPSEEVKRGIVKNWALVNFSGLSDKETTSFCCKLIRMCVRMGMEFFPVATRMDHVMPECPTDVEKALWAMDFKLSRIFYDPEVEGNPIGLLIIILPECTCSHAKVEETCRSIGVVYQCFSAQDARALTNDSLMDAAVEINDKVLKRLHTGVPRPIITPIPFLSEAPTIIFGADISRSTPGEGLTSTASVVATMHWPGVNKYRALASHQPHAELVIKDLINDQEKGSWDLVSELLLTFSKNTNQQAKRIIFFRNVGSEGQLYHICCSEIKAIEEACTRSGMGHVPITFVIVAQTPSHEAQGKGEMIDSEHIPHGSELGHCMNFSYSCPKEGISSSTHYYVLHDENDFTTDQLKSLCIHLCTPRFLWNYPQISMVTPAYLAQLAASIARKYVESKHGSGSKIPIRLPEIKFP
ncbi:hypothetical protein EJB05_20456 [Eragrostis curvula]|uniref:Piwi domain-containing protein n=1 Tax=Eragrostis curvula TaxID=38414 RepID=A0A5J9V0D0_9POAL|nr:hypothetical protein EJB05_20456 [Eragrostis curvula]